LLFCLACIFIVEKAKGNTDTKDTVHTLKSIFDKKKIEERQALAKLFAQNAYEEIHCFAARKSVEIEAYNEQHSIKKDNPWKDGGLYRVLLHTATAGITAELAGKPASSGAIAGAINEAAINKIIDAVGKDHPDQAQLLSALLGGLVNKVIGRPVLTGVAVAQYGTKYNELGLLDTVRNTINNEKFNIESKVMNEARYFVQNGFLSPENMVGDYYITQISIGEGLKVASVACIVDKDSNVYASAAFNPGATIGVPITTGFGTVSNKKYLESIPGWLNISAIARRNYRNIFIWPDCRN